MKVKNYEKNSLILFISIFIFLSEIVLIIFLYKYKIYEYKVITGIVSNKNIVTLVISKDEKELLYKNKKIYINNKYLNYKIIDDKGYLLKKNKKKYYEVLISIKTNKEENDVVNLCIKNKKIRIIKLLKNIWEGGKSE